MRVEKKKSFSLVVPTLCYLPKVLRHVVLQFALHQMTKQRLDLIEDALIWLVSVVLDGQESLRNTHSANSMPGHVRLSGLERPLVTAAGKRTTQTYLGEAGLHVELLKHGVHVAGGPAVLQPNEP